MNFGPLEFGIILVVVLIIFGPSQLPKLGRSLGATIREFRGVGKAITETRDEVEETVRAVEHEIRK